jgi:hypothetical protein
MKKVRLDAPSPRRQAGAVSSESLRCVTRARSFNGSNEPAADPFIFTEGRRKPLSPAFILVARGLPVVAKEY